MTQIEKRMGDALKTRLQHDHPEVFDKSTWKDDTLDKFYPDEAFVDIVILQVTQNVCASDNLAMPASVQRNLAKAVNLDSSGQEAVDAMVEAHAFAKPIPAAGNGVTSHMLQAHQAAQFAATIAAIQQVKVKPASTESSRKAGAKPERKQGR